MWKSVSQSVTYSWWPDWCHPGETPIEDLTGVTIIGDEEDEEYKEDDEDIERNYLVIKSKVANLKSSLFAG